jgi:hypothetical protein
MLETFQKTVNELTGNTLVTHEIFLFRKIKLEIVLRINKRKDVKNVLVFNILIVSPDTYNPIFYKQIKF